MNISFAQFTQFAVSELHVSLPTQPIFYIGPMPITNTMVLGGAGVTVMLLVLFYVKHMVQRGRYNRLVGLIQWMFEGFYTTCYEIVPDRKVARSIAPLALTIFFTVLFTYWISILPGVGESLKWGDAPLLRGLPTDLNFTLALAIITMVAVQYYAMKVHGIFGNAGRYVKNPLKDPLGAFEGFLEIIGEFSRLVALSFRLFGNAFAGEVLLMIVAIMSGYLAGLSLPFFMAFELFIGFIQAYVFYMLTLIFASLAVISHGDHGPAHDSPKRKIAHAEH
jgi:F-type H+-transporting ATPase subunit a